MINGHKWWISGAGDPRCKISIFMGQSNPDAPAHQRQSMILVPMDTKGVTIKRMMHVFGYDDAPHGHAEIMFENVRVPAENMLLGEGRGFEIAQGRLGPGRIHHCMRLIGVAERALELMCRRVTSRVAFGKTARRAGHHSPRHRGVAHRDRSGAAADDAGGALDGYGRQQGGARRDRDDQGRGAERRAAVLDRAIQAHGAAGVSQDTFLAHAWASSRTLRLADGPDEVHLETIAKLELKKS